MNRFLLKQCEGMALRTVARVNVGGARGRLAGRSLSRIPSAKGLSSSNNFSLHITRANQIELLIKELEHLSLPSLLTP